MELLYLNSLDETKKYWDKLDLEYYHPIYSNYNFYKECYNILLTIPCITKYTDPLFLVGIENEKIIGLLPLIKENYKYTFFHLATGCVSYEPPIRPEYLHLFLEFSKIKLEFYDLVCSYIDINSIYSKYYYWVIPNIIDLTNITTIEEYIQSLNGKNRNKLKRIIKKNKDIYIKEGIPEQYKRYKKLYDFKHWVKRKGYSIQLFLSLYEIILKYSQDILSLTFYKEDKVVGIRQSSICNNILQYYPTIRPTLYSNYIGLYSIYIEIEYAIKRHVKYYDFAIDSISSSPVSTRYKKLFLNQYNIKTPCGMSLGTENNIFPPYFNGKEWIF